MAEQLSDFYARALRRQLAGQIPVGLKLPLPSCLSTDSRTITQHQWFLPLVGEHFDGHDFIQSALRRGSPGFFYEIGRSTAIPENLRALGIPVHSTLATLQDIALAWRQSLKNLKVLALSGSVGKTTTREFTRSLLASVATTHATEGNYNNEIGVPLTILQLTTNHQFAVLELGARHIGDLELLTSIADPDVVAILNVGAAHVGEFGGFENLFRAKMELYRHARSTAVAVSPSDDQRIQLVVRETGHSNVTFGLTGSPTVRIGDTRWLDSGAMEVDLIAGGTTYTFPVGLGHVAFPINVCAAAAMAMAAGVSLDKVQNGLRKFVGLAGRYSLIRLGNQIIIDDCYNASPQSMMAGLASLGRGFPDCKRIVVLADMLEMGDEAEEAHRGIGPSVAKMSGLILLITVGNHGKIIGDAAIASGLDSRKVLSLASVDDLIGLGRTVLADADVVYVKGSNGMGLRRFLDCLTKER